MPIGQTIQDQSISMNDDNEQIINKIDDDDYDDEENNHNDNSKKISSNSNVFSRLMHSEPHVQNNKKTNGCCLNIYFYPIAAITANALIIILEI
jgi:hypothetical protein